MSPAWTAVFRLWMSRSVLVSLVLSLAGLAIFKRWEMLTPSHEQFELEVQVCM
jgi:hypothetical protein